MGLQLFTLRAAMAQDVAGTLKRIAAMGYEEVETYGFDDGAIRYYGMDAKAFRQMLAANKLTTSSGHYDLNKFVASPVGDSSATSTNASTALERWDRRTSPGRGWTSSPGRSRSSKWWPSD